MNTYKILVDGFEVAVIELTESEVRAYNTLSGVAVVRA